MTSTASGRVPQLAALASPGKNSSAGVVPACEATSNWLAKFGMPCDPVIFAEAIDAWVKGVEVPLRLPPKSVRRRGGFYLTDIPVNRAAMATVAFLRKRGVESSQSYLWRVMHFQDILCRAAEFGLGEHVRADEVSRAFVHAAAGAKIGLDEEIGFDIHDFKRLVEAYESREAGARREQ